jgi:hypothetical protein
VKIGLEFLTMILERRIKRHLSKYYTKSDEGTGKYIHEIHPS